MTTKFKVIFAIIMKDGAALNSVQKGTAEILFGGGVVDCYNKAAALLNPHYEEWNKLYDESSDEKYDDFIIRNANAVLSAEKWGSIKPFMGYFPGEESCELLFEVFGSIWGIRLEPIEE